MKANILFSGGKDSSLCSLLLESFFDIKLITCTFGLLETSQMSRNIAEILGFSHEVIELNKNILIQACKIIIQDGFPNNAINYIHRQALLEVISKKKKKNYLIADGLRRDDKVPKFELSEIKSLENKYCINYISPLIGYGRSTIDQLVEKYLEIEENESKIMKKCDYESELRESLNIDLGEKETDKLFPSSHMQSRVISRKNI